MACLQEPLHADTERMRVQDSFPLRGDQHSYCSLGHELPGQHDGQCHRRNSIHTSMCGQWAGAVTSHKLFMGPWVMQTCTCR